MPSHNKSSRDISKHNKTAAQGLRFKYIEKLKAFGLNKSSVLAFAVKQYAAG